MTFDPDNVERLYEGGVIDYRVGADSDYDALLALYRLTHRALELSIVRRKVGQHFEDECAEFEHWMSMAQREVAAHKKTLTD